MECVRIALNCYGNTIGKLQRKLKTKINCSMYVKICVPPFVMIKDNPRPPGKLLLPGEKQHSGHLLFFPTGVRGCQQHKTAYHLF